MPTKIDTAPAPAETELREAVCIHTGKIYGSCRDKDCLEDLRVYLTSQGQCAVENAVSVRAKSAEIISAVPEVEPVCFNRGYYTVDVRFFYRVRGEVCTAGGAAVPIAGLATFSKRVLLFGSEGSAKVFTSRGGGYAERGMPTAIVEAVDPIVLDMRLVDACAPAVRDCQVLEVPACISSGFDGPLVTDATGRYLQVTLGQFSIVRLERDSQLMVPCYDYCLPDKACGAGGGGDDPCALFSRIDFPVNEFFPPDTVTSPEDYRDFMSGK